MSPSSVGLPNDDDSYPPQKLHPLREFTPSTHSDSFYQNYHEGIPIALDLGTLQFRVGLCNSEQPNQVFPPLVLKYRDRRLQQLLTLIGNDVVNDWPLLRLLLKTPYDGPLVTNWEQFENIIDYLFEYMGVTGLQGLVNNPVVVTEPVGCPFAQRKQMYELMFEVYQVPKLALGIDHLFSYYQNLLGNSTGLVIGAGNEATHLIPVVNGKGIMSQTKRIDYGGNVGAAYLAKLLALKYPYFPQKLSLNHTMEALKDWCYVLSDYNTELKSFLDMPVLEKKDIVLQYPVEVAPQHKKTEEELAKQLERRREQGRRLQEQTRAKRAEKMAQKEQELKYFNDLKARHADATNEEWLEVVQLEEFDTAAEFRKYVTNLEKTLKRANGDDDDDDEFDPATAWPLVDIADDELTPEQIKEKRKQKLHKGNWEARERIKQEKREAEDAAAQRLKDEEEWRARDLEDYCATKHAELARLKSKFKDLGKMIELMKDRKLAAAQMRMRNITELANEAGTSLAQRKRRKGASALIDNDPNDTFGANDEDWAVYRLINSKSLEEEQSRVNGEIVELEKLLLEHDPNFNHQDTFAAALVFDWKNLVLHKFVHGPRPNIALKLLAEGMEDDEIANQPEVITKNHQMHLNIERIRVPEVLFQPHMAGLDQMGITEIASDLFHRRLDGRFVEGGQSYSMIQDVFLTGGLVKLPNFELRIRSDLTSILPMGAPLKVRTAQDPELDAWRGMRKWASLEDLRGGYITRKEYDEYGPEYIKEHNLGNVMLR